MRIIRVFFPFWVLLLTACSYIKVENEKGTGLSNKVKKGENFRVSLPEDHKTKYLWTFKKDVSSLRVDFMGSVFHGTYVDFNFEARGRGKEELTFYLYSAKDTLQTKRFVVEVE